jgi:hypothetical protein
MQHSGVVSAQMVSLCCSYSLDFTFILVVTTGNEPSNFPEYQACTLTAISP